MSGGNEGLLLVISGPSGVGKTSIVGGLRRRLGGCFSVSATTRPRAAGEVEGRDYFFVDEPAFAAMVQRGEMLEHACVFGRHWYGTPRAPVEEALGRGALVILDIDVQGAMQVRSSMPHALMIFILPPGEEELLRRLRGRARDDEAAIQRRFEEARREIAMARSSGVYDHLVVNDVLDRAIDQVCEMVRKRRAAGCCAGS
jgi:guanylate kinase